MATLTVDQIKQVLTLLRDQPGFRSNLINDPANTLTGIGIISDASDIPQPPEQVRLPSDAAISARLNELADEVVAGKGVIRQLLQLDD